MDYAYNGLLVFINLGLWLILLLVYKKDFLNPFINRKRSFIFPFIILALFTTFAFSEADTYHYHEIYDRMLKINSQIHIEYVYYFLLKILPKNYYLWRFVIWGAASFIFVITAKRYRINPGILAFLLPVLLFQQFAVTRGCLGISIFLLAVSFILKPVKQRKLFSILIGIFGCLVSMAFHKSMPLFIFIFVLSCIPLNRFFIYFLILIFPLLRSFVVSIIMAVIDMGFFEQDTVTFTMGYLDGERSISNIMGLIRLGIEYVPRFLIIYIITRLIILNKQQVPYYISYLAHFCFILFYIALLCYGQEFSSFISSRTIHMMCFPLIIVVSYLVERTGYNKLVLSSVILFIISDLFAFLHSIYKWS